MKIYLFDIIDTENNSGPGSPRFHVGASVANPIYGKVYTNSTLITTFACLMKSVQLSYMEEDLKYSLGLVGWLRGKMLHFWNKARYFASSKYRSYCSFSEGVPGEGTSRGRVPTLLTLVGPWARKFENYPNLWHFR